MEQASENWQADLERKAQAAQDAKDAESNPAEGPTQLTREQLEAEGWRFRAPASGGEVYKAVTEGNEIKIINMGGQDFIFDKIEGFKDPDE
jgi:hypothetical protein